MKMGTIASPWRYDAAAAKTILLDNQRRTTILRYALWAAAFPISLVVRLPFDSGPFDQSRDRRDGPLSDILAPCRGEDTPRCHKPYNGSHSAKCSLAPMGRERRRRSGSRPFAGQGTNCALATAKPKATERNRGARRRKMTRSGARA